MSSSGSEMFLEKEYGEELLCILEVGDLWGLLVEKESGRLSSTER